MSMKTPCVGVEPQVTELCEPTCVRWTELNEGNVLKVYHDKSEWDPTHYPLISEPDPDVYLVQAIAVWNDAYPCGTLFELTDNLAEAKITVEYEQKPVGECSTLATALCVCDEESELCVRQLDHSTFFDVDNKLPIIMNMLNGCNNQDFMTHIRWTNTMAHELGHALGMGHVFDQPYLSIMGDRDNSAVQIYDHDRQQLALRHPCNCIMVNPLKNAVPGTPDDYEQSAVHCKGCAY